MEWVPETYITRVIFSPDFDSNKVNSRIETSARVPVEILIAQPTKEYDGDRVSESGIFACPLVKVSAVPFEELSISIPDVKPWSPEEPWLYPVKITAGHDTVISYFGMRKVSLESDEKGISRIFLNNRPYFMNGVLDQGYWPDGLMTPASDEAFIYDIVQMKSAGMNMLRKHIKIEPMRWYYHCDRLGMLVW